MSETEPVREQFGNRVLNDESEVFKHNAWDRVEWDEEQAAEANDKITKQINSSGDYQSRYSELTESPAEQWDAFYQKHDSKFFKERAWLFTEFKRLNPTNSPTLNVLEVGCGNGSNIIPLLQASKDCENYKVWGCDFAPKSVELVQENELVKEAGEEKVTIFLHDLSSEDEIPVKPASIDAVICTFVLSAIPSETMKNAVAKMVRTLKPGGEIFFRDYGRHDMAQLRFKPGRVVGENFYSRGDGTLVYFYTENDITELFSDLDMENVQMWTDRRLQINRAKRLKMYRVWIQSIFKKAESS